nr:unnamed protein product [Digitaria exilis]
MASNNDRPLLVVHDDKEGHLVYDLLLLLLDGEAENDAAAALACFPRPVAHFAASLGLRALAVSGGAVVGAFYDFWGDTLIHDTVMDNPGCGGLVRWPNKHSFTASRDMGVGPTNAPAMIPMADGTVIRLDTTLFDDHYAF